MFVQTYSANLLCCCELSGIGKVTGDRKRAGDEVTGHATIPFVFVLHNFLVIATIIAPPSH